MLLTDTHTHLYYTTEAEELREQMKRCEENGVRKMILPNVDVESLPLLYHTVQQYPNHCYAMIGLHPCSVKKDYQEQLAYLKEQIDQCISTSNPVKIYAIGEIGLDLYWDQSTINIQQDAFRIQTQWAKELDLPVSIHCREAFDPLFELLEEVQDGRLRGVLHCFTGNLVQAERLIQIGLYLGIGGVVTYKKAGLDEVVKQLPIDKLVLETDSPYLAPVPYRGKKNESSYVLNIAEKLADLHQVSVEEVARITSNTAASIFKLI
jgi:TatD DNase family protein